MRDIYEFSSDFFIVSRADALEQYERAKDMLTAIKAFLN